MYIYMYMHVCIYIYICVRVYRIIDLAVAPGRRAAEWSGNSSGSDVFFMCLLIGIRLPEAESTPLTPAPPAISNATVFSRPLTTAL